MPITGLTDVPRAFLKLGQIRKGEKDPRTGAPRDLDYFRVTFYDSEKECEQLFREVYGEQPRSINIRLAFPNVEDVWDANLECYSKGGLIAKAMTTQDPATLQEVAKWLFYRDHETGQVLVRNGFPVGDDGLEFIKRPIDLTKPVYSYKNRNGETAEAFLEPVGRLNVVIPELASIRVGFLEFRPGSPKDIAALSRELAAIDHMARQAGRDITGIPMKLTRREEEITKNINGKLSRGPSWLVHIEIGGEWGGRALEYIERLALPEWVDAQAVEVMPEPLEELEWDADIAEDYDGEPPVQPKSKAVAREGAPGISAKFLVDEGIVKHINHGEALMKLLSIPDGAPIEESKARIARYNEWRSTEEYSRNDADTREKAAAKAIAGERP